MTAAPVGVAGLIVTPVALPLPSVRLTRLAPAVAVGLCVAAGLGLRVGAFARNPSLWGDEAMLALNVVHRPVAELLTPLDLNQGAPVGYLVLVRLLVQAFGQAEWVLRLPSLIAGLAAVPLFAAVAYRGLPVVSARWAVGLFALSPHVVGYSAEFKQYELDLGLTTLLLLLGQSAWRSCTPAAFARLAAGGAAAVWVSHPAAFVLGGVGLALVVHPADRRRVWPRLLVGAVWAASFLACYLLFTRRLGANAYLTAYWAGAFWPVPPRGPGDLAWLAHHVTALFELPGGFSTTGFGAGGLAAVCAAVGLMSLARTDRRLAAAIAAPVGLALVASAAEKYPFAGRLMLFAVPLLLLAVGHGLAVLGELLRPLGRAAGPVVAGVLVAPMLCELDDQAKKPAHAEDVRAAMAHVSAHWRPGDRLLVTPGAHPAVGYYLPRTVVPAESTAVVRPDLAGVPPGRAWVVIAHTKPAAAAELRARLGERGTCTEVLAADGAAVLACDIGRRP